MPTLQRNGSTLYYELYDEAPSSDNAPTVVLLHGVGGNHASWFHQITAWRARWRVVVPDARGFGNSTDAEGLGRSGFVDDLAAVLEATGCARVVLVGQSMGAGTAISYACANPQRVAGLVVADSLFGIDLPGGVRERMDALTARNASLSQIARVLGATTVATRPDMATLYTALASFNSVNVRTLTGVQQLHRPDDISATGVPTLFVVGGEDVLFPPDEVREVQRCVAGSSFALLETAGHSAYFEAPDAFNAAVEDWLARVGGA
ncbi:alpha/beta hydrolase [Burkholderia multivorans]|uniref:alpha/beta fold hydrolase n=1 Tax=Burkholderia multivorans TaxID=87883 RepID=UPI001C2146A5|nr:alpha/beta hydrolase [Burkholderia multivorans]MBU9651096.1 alpha/beta hydrolase [Burkholderia multivorans]